MIHNNWGEINVTLWNSKTRKQHPFHLLFSLMQDLTIIFIIPLLVAIIGGAAVVIFEYYVVKPRAEVLIPHSSPISRDWATAIRKAVKKFKLQQTDYDWNWWSSDRNSITIESWTIEKGQANVMLAILGECDTVETPVPGVLQLVTKRQVIAKYNLAIDRTGDILRMNVLPFGSANTNVQVGFHQKNLPETKLTIKNKKQPVVQRINGDVKVIIEFDIENSGKAGKACSYIEFQVVAPNRFGNLTPQPVRTAPMSIDIPALTTKPIKFEKTFHAPEWPLVDSLSKIRIELFPCPDAR